MTAQFTDYRRVLTVPGANSSSQTIDSAWAEYRKTVPVPTYVWCAPFGYADLEAAFRAGAAVSERELEPAEKTALTVGLAQVLRGDEPMPNIASVCILALARLTGRELTDTHRDPSRPSDGQKVIRDMASASVHVPIEDPARDGGGHPAGLQSGVPPQREGETGGVTRNAGAPCVASSPPAKEPQL
jgi:hypothetical protein